jgi:hypothetical protein
MATPSENINFVKSLLPFGQLRRMRIIGSVVSTSRHFAYESRLLFQLKQAQLFEALSGPFPIAIAHIR